MTTRFSIRHSTFDIPNPLLTREIRDLILVITGFGRMGDEFIVHVAGEVFVHIKLTSLELRVERRVFFVDDFVTGKMFAAHRRGFGEGVAPDFHRLAGNREHQVDIHVIKSGFAQRIEGFEHHLAAMDATEAVEELFIKRLHAHGDAVHAKTAEKFGFIERNGGRIAFDGEFFRAEQPEALHGGENVFPLPQIEHGRSATAEENGARLEVGGDELEFAGEGADVAIDQFTAGSLGKKGAIFAFLRAKRDVDVKTGDGLWLHVTMVPPIFVGDQRNWQTVRTSVFLQPCLRARLSNM